jgi:1-deoxy-D-xylulose-5-phosphate synthase
MQPRNEDEFVDMLWTMACYESGPIAIRYPRGNGPGIMPKDKPVRLEIGKAEVIADGSDVALIALGDMFPIAEAAKIELEAKGLSVALINPRWIKPLDMDCISSFARKVKVVCTLEDHVLRNGFGTGVIEQLSDAGIHTPVVRIGWPDQFIEHGTPSVLRKKHGLSVENTVAKVLGALGQA